MAFGGSEKCSWSPGCNLDYCSRFLMLAVPIDNWRSYNDILSVQPIQTKAITSATRNLNVSVILATFLATQNTRVIHA